MLHIHLVHMTSPGPEASCPGTTRQGDQIRERATPTRDAYLRAQQYVIPRRRHGQVTKVLGQVQHITTELLADSGKRTPGATVSLHQSLYTKGS